MSVKISWLPQEHPKLQDFRLKQMQSGHAPILYPRDQRYEEKNFFPFLLYSVSTRKKI